MPPELVPPGETLTFSVVTLDDPRDLPEYSGEAKHLRM